MVGNGKIFIAVDFSCVVFEEIEVALQFTWNEVAKQ